ncbi:MAG: tetratricopeptide repeat protein [Chitinophagaceae bacterium]|nr:tetratricopeptide repeat protein [Chitinophagaceae bacterium]
MYSKPVIILLFCLTTINSTAQNNLAAAASLAREGKFNEAIKAYSEILISDQTHIAARLGRGFTYSWKHDFVNARADFNTVLVADPANTEAQKGLAYTDLWSGDYKNAIRSFDKLIEISPGVKEYYIARGQAQMNDGLLKDARLSFQKAEQLAPNDAESKQLLTAVKTKPTILDVDIIGGLSSADGISKTGLRYVQVSSQVSKQLQLAAKYDNSLSMDNLGLITINKSIPYYAGSLFYKWSNKTASKIEGGFRNFSDAKAGEASSESQFTLEQIFFLKKGRSLKAGAAFISPDAGSGASLFFAGYHQPVSKKTAAGITWFYAGRNVFNTTENRFLLDADFYLSKGNMLNAGFYYGRSNSDNRLFEGNTYGGFLKAFFPVSNSVGIHLGISAENNFIQNLFNANAGVRFRLEK